MPEQQYKRNTAFKLRIGEILMGKPVIEGDKFLFLELGSKRISRVNIVGNIIERYESEGDKKYLFFTFDDGSGQIGLKVFGDDVGKFKDFTQGLTVAVIGVLRSWNNQIYITPEIIKDKDPRYLLVRKLEIEKERSKNKDPLGKDEIVAVKDKILRTIKNSEELGGIEVEKIVINLTDISPVIITQEIQKMVEEGLIFEPRPGKVRYLG